MKIGKNINVCNLYVDLRIVQFFMPYGNPLRQFDALQLLKRRWIYSLSNNCSIVATF